MAVTPLWQEEQVPETAAWSKLTEVQLLVTWQSSQVLELEIWLAPLPVADTPLWQVEQVPDTDEWSKLTAVQLLVT